MRILTGVVWVALLLLASGHAQQLVTVDRADGAKVPLMVYGPGNGTNHSSTVTNEKTDAAACAPLLIFSPGLGGTERGYSYLAQAAAADGWRVLVMGHKESGPDALWSSVREYGIRPGLQHDLKDPQQNRARLMDVDAALRYADGICRAPVKVLGGHSFGAVTVMEEAGATNCFGLKPTAEFDGYFAMSPEGPGLVFDAGAWKGIDKRIMLLTGTKDLSASGDWHSRLQAFAEMPPGRGAMAGCKWMGVEDSASHMNFAGHGIGAEKFEALNVAAVRAFLQEVRSGKCGPPPPLSGVTWQSK
jgi:hypothetical protein